MSAVALLQSGNSDEVIMFWVPDLSHGAQQPDSSVTMVEG
jgi:hypothetical protein